jgi:hypothetical protein
MPPACDWRPFFSQARNLKRDIETIDPIEDISFGVTGALVALFARNPSLITKQASVPPARVFTGKM